MGPVPLGLVLVMQVTAIWAQSGLDCPIPWVLHADKCYRFQDFPSDIGDAEGRCAEDRASLVSINTRAEHDFITDYLQRNDRTHREWFTSGKRDSEDYNQFHWEGDGTDITDVQFWFNQEARQGLGNNIVYYSDGNQYGWVMREQDIIKPYICEISLSEVYNIVQEERGFDYGTGEIDPAKLEKGPRFLIQPDSTIYDTDGVDRFIYFECAAESLPPSQYKWTITKESQTITVDPFKDNRYTLTNGRLTIHEPSDATDNGDYQCSAENKFGSILSNVVQLSFGYLLDFPKSKREAVVVDAHKGVGIECNPPKHYPEILYSWYKDSFMNFVRPSLKEYIFISNNGKLYFSEVTMDDWGEYYCLVFSPRASITASKGKVSMPIPLRINEAIASIQEPTIVSEFPALFPSSPIKGDNLRIECFAWGTRFLDYRWEKEGSSLPVNSHLEDHDRVLVIPEVQEHDNGRYKCTVTRRNGLSDSKTITVRIDAEPYFRIPLRNQFVDHNADMTWRCIAKGIPSVVYSWYRNATLLTMDTLPPDVVGRLTINNNVLSLRQVTPADNAMYQCAATNLHGKRFSSAQLRVVSMPPSFDKFPVQPKIYATLRRNVTIVCSPEAAPRPEVEWFKDDRPLNPSQDPAARVRQLPNNYLYITQVSQGDRGHYTCKATLR